MVFDEIDTGISGEPAKQVGLLLQQLGQNRQVLCITHQPQIAAKGHTHLYVYKEQKGKGELFLYQAHDHTLDFYNQQIVLRKSIEELKELSSNHWVYTNSEGYRTVLNEKLPFEIVHEFPDYPVTQLSIPFLYKETRATTLDTVYLIKHR